MSNVIAAKARQLNGYIFLSNRDPHHVLSGLLRAPAHGRTLPHMHTLKWAYTTTRKGGSLMKTRQKLCYTFQIVIPVGRSVQSHLEHSREHFEAH